MIKLYKIYIFKNILNIFYQCKYLIINKIDLEIYYHLINNNKQ